ncbi:hypothetical protein MSG28_005062 [Choristoneura fumiferana]|uniref:Uncharacterized protein n=1 Tax=Choristoneura fumiferana TaxID=7141 RepID=A0ACC0JPQ1_CHOFU|nr:hypothetical protein MSG28_005062 [Choristoneura fumiferana]
MWSFMLTFISAICLATQICSGINFIDIPKISNPSPEKVKAARRFWLRNFGELGIKKNLRVGFDPGEKDNNLKEKITMLVEQAVYDTDRKIQSIQSVKKPNSGPYKIGFILSMIKKTRDVLNELFNVAVKHRDEWKALEQLKIFELIVHTNVDTTNLVRQLVELHIQNLNVTGTQDARRVVLLK